jgi:hypothetical protein
LRRYRFDAYLDKVFGFSERVSSLPEGRQYPQHPWKKVFDAVFLGAACQFASLHEIETECCSGVLRRRVGLISEDTLRYALQRQDPDDVLQLGCEVCRRLKRNGVLQTDWARGRVVAAVDGTEICSSFARCCDRCMERKVQRKVQGKLQESIQYYHRIVAVTVVSTPFSIPLGIRFQKQGEGEVDCALGLLRELHERLGRRFLDVLVGDALYLQEPFVQAVEALGLEWVFTLKQNQPELLAEAQRLTTGEADMEQSDSKEKIQLWHAPQVYWPIADRDVRVVKAVRTQKMNQVRIDNDQVQKQAVKEQVEKQSTNFFASNMQLDAIPPIFVYQLGQSRWAIDTEVFQTITTDSHLKHPSVHQGHDRALVMLSMIRLLAYMLTMVFYHRQVRSHRRRYPLGFCDLAKKLAYHFLVEPFDTS